MRALRNEFVADRVRRALIASALVLVVGCGGGEAPESETALAPDAGPGVEAGAAEVPDIDLGRVVATVNGEDITLGKVYQVVEMNVAKMIQSGVTVTDDGLFAITGVFRPPEASAPGQPADPARALADLMIG